MTLGVVDTNRIAWLAGWALILIVPLWAGYHATTYSYFRDLPDARITIDRMVFLAEASGRPGSRAREGPEIQLPHDWRGLPRNVREGWYAAKLVLDVPPNRLWGLYVSGAHMNLAVFLNGELLGDGGRFQDPVARRASHPMYFPIPNGMLRSGENLLQIRVKSDPGSLGYLGRLHLGPHEFLGPVFEKQYMVRYTLVAVIVGLLMFMGVWSGTICLLRRCETLYGWFAAMTITWGLHTLNLVVIDIPVPTRIWDWAVSYVLLGAFVGFLVGFVHRFLGLRRRALESLIFGWLVFWAIWMLFLEEARFYGFAMWFWNGGLFLIGLYPAALLLRTYWQKGGLTVLLVTLAGSTITVLALRDWLVLVGMLSHRGEGYFVQYAAPVLMLVFAGILLRDFVTARNESEALNRELEARIADKTRELETQYQRLNTLKQEELLLRERERLMRDMHDGMGGQLVAALALAERGSDHEEIAGVLRDSLQDLRLLIHSMDPADGDLSALLGLFRARLEQQLEGSGIVVDWKVRDVPLLDHLDPGVALNLLRIVQEAVTNVVRHAQAGRLTIATGFDENNLYVDIDDDGVGISNTVGSGRGIPNMHQRAQSIGASLDMIPLHPGTRVRIRVPRTLVSTMAE